MMNTEALSSETVVMASSVIRARLPHSIGRFLTAVRELVDEQDHLTLPAGRTNFYQSVIAQGSDL